MKKLKKDIGSILQKYRVEAGYSQGDMQNITGITRNHLSAVERGLFKLNMRTLLTYIDVCHIPVSEFFEKGEI